MKPPLTYYGGKQKLSKLILSHIPKHTLYCEPFFGGGAVFFSKTPSKVEVINDTNGELVNFYKVVRTQFRGLKKEIKATLHSRKQYQAAVVIYRHPELFDEIKRAWAVWVLASQSFASKLNGHFGYDRTESKTTRQIHEKQVAFVDEFSKRLELTQIECTDALRVIRSRDSKDSFFYCDPPYLNADQGHYRGYTEYDFEKLLNVLASIKGKFLLSSYPSELLSKYSKQHKWFTKKVDVILSVGGKKKKTKRELLTANYPI